jgi:hypothetical protein
MGEAGAVRMPKCDCDGQRATQARPFPPPQGAQPLLVLTPFALFISSSHLYAHQKLRGDFSPADTLPYLGGPSSAQFLLSHSRPHRIRAKTNFCSHAR